MALVPPTDPGPFMPTVRFRDDPAEYKRQYGTYVRRGGRRHGHTPSKPAIHRMLNYINRDPGELVVAALGPCWVWTGARNADGYGIIRGDKDPDTGKQPLLLAHRLALAAALNRPLGEGLVACHRCHFRRCVRPSHLYEGTVQDNNNDVWELRRARGREAGSI